MFGWKEGMARNTFGGELGCKAKRDALTFSNNTAAAARRGRGHAQAASVPRASSRTPRAQARSCPPTAIVQHGTAAADSPGENADALTDDLSAHRASLTQVCTREAAQELPARHKQCTDLFGEADFALP